MKIKNIFLVCVMAVICLAFTTTEVMAEEQEKLEQEWNLDKTIKKTEGAFTYYAYPSKDGRNAWIYEIKINTKKNHSKLKIPKTIDKKSVTRLGFTYMTMKKFRDADICKNLFGNYVEIYHDYEDAGEGSSPAVNGIKEITIPKSVKIIQSEAFAGMESITRITIPDGVTEIQKGTFYSCKNLKTIQLPANLKEMSPCAVELCLNLTNFKLSSKNKTYKIIDGCVVRKKDQALICVPSLGKDQVFNIPKGIKKINCLALGNCTSENVNISSTVKSIDKEAFKRRFSENPNIRNVTVSNKNHVLAQDGQCIYNKKDKSLVIAIPDSQGVLRITDKVEKLTDDYIRINNNIEAESIKLKKIIYPENLKTVQVPGFKRLSAKKVYFMGAKPPVIKIDKKGKKYGALIPTKADVYVPKASDKLYEKWYWKYDEYLNVDWHNFDPVTMEEFSEEI